MKQKTKIIATVGPSCDSVRVLRTLIKKGVSVFRINASHTTPKGIRDWTRLIRRAAASEHCEIAIMVDLQGPRVRTGALLNKQPLILVRGEIVVIEPTLKSGRPGYITTTCRQLPDMVKPGDTVLLDNGFIELRVTKRSGKRVTCKVIAGGKLGENKGINLPYAPVTLPALTAGDREDLRAALRAGVDFVALSFVRSERDLKVIKHWMKRFGRVIPVIAKIEKPRAVARLNEILHESDSIMIARGDLGIEMGVDRVPIVQKDLIRQANWKRVPVITATQMLESMMEQMRPTRAEASDIANAVFDGTDAVMLSGETAIGKHPIEAVQTMSHIILEAEKNLSAFRSEAVAHDVPEEPGSPIHAITHAARHAARDLRADAIIVYTRSGRTATLVSKFRPISPIIALTPNDEACRRLCLCRGVYPIKVAYGKSTDAMIRAGERTLVKYRLLRQGNQAVIVSGKQALPGARYMTKILRVGIKEK